MPSLFASPRLMATGWKIVPAAPGSGFYGLNFAPAAKRQQRENEQPGASILNLVPAILDFFADGAIFIERLYWINDLFCIFAFSKHKTQYNGEQHSNSNQGGGIGTEPLFYEFG